jgi:hypothetical protein
LIGDNVSTTEHKQILRAEEEFLTSRIRKYLELLNEAEKKWRCISFKRILKKLVLALPQKRNSRCLSSKEIIINNRFVYFYRFIEDLAFLNKELLQNLFRVDTEFRRTTKDNMKLALLAGK